MARSRERGHGPLIELDFNPADGPWAAAVLTHPHPDFGGSRFNVVVDHLYRGLPPAGVSTVRFDFSSADLHVAAAETVEALSQTTVRPQALVGYSFGADVAATIDDDRVAGWFLIAPPFVDAKRPRPIAADPRPKALAVPELDQFSSPGRSGHITESWVNTSVATVPGADHFLVGHTHRVVDQVLAWFRTAIL